MVKSKQVNQHFNFLVPRETNDLTRLGSQFDGGYIVPKNLTKNTDTLISFGYGYDYSFEIDYIDFTNNNIYVYDYSCSTYDLIKHLFKNFKRFLLFRRKFEDVKYVYFKLINHLKFINNKKISFIKKKVVSNSEINSKLSSDEVTIDKIFNQKNFSKTILKCDIEGEEYKIIDNILDHHKKIDVIVMEFHWLNKNLVIFEKNVKKILKYFTIVHIHGNNNNSLIENLNFPEVPEITFINNKHCNNLAYSKKFPVVNLDSPNNPKFNDLHFYFN